jgi:DNA-binding transcriptional MerR regulator
MDKLLTSAEVCEILGVSPDTLRVWDEKGKLLPESKTAGGHRRYDENFILKFKLMRDFMEDCKIYIDSVFSEQVCGIFENKRVAHFVDLNNQQEYFQKINNKIRRKKIIFIDYNYQYSKKDDKINCKSNFIQFYIFTSKNVIYSKFPEQENLHSTYEHIEIIPLNNLQLLLKKEESPIKLEIMSDSFTRILSSYGNYLQKSQIEKIFEFLLEEQCN